MADVIEVCPKCFNELAPGHVCGGAQPVSAKQSAFQKQDRKKYVHDVELETRQVIVMFNIEVPAGSDFKAEWLHDQLKERMDIPEGPEDYPEIEPYYIKDIW